MKKTKKALLFTAAALALTMLLGSCQPKQTSSIQIVGQEAGATQQHQFDSPYTVGYQNKDESLSLYIYASPIQYKDGNEYKPINNGLTEAGVEGFAYKNRANDVTTLIPKTMDEDFSVRRGDEYLTFKPNTKGVTFSTVEKAAYKNAYGMDVEAALFKSDVYDVAFYPTNAGLKAEISVKQALEKTISFYVTSSGQEVINGGNGYCLFKNGQENIGVIYAPVIINGNIREESGTVQPQNKMTVNPSEKGGYYFILELPEGVNPQQESPVILDCSFELYQNKMPDSSVYSKFGTNSYLRNWAIVGNHPEMGEGLEYLRQRLQFIMSAQSAQIASAQYCTYPMYVSKDKARLQLLQNDRQWSSTRMLWSDRFVTEKVISSVDIKKADTKIDFDITEFVKTCFADPSDWMPESYGMMLRSTDTDGWAMVASSDNSLLQPYIKIDFKTPPEVFYPPTNINPAS